MAKKKQQGGIDLPQGLSQVLAKSPDKLAAFGHMDDNARAALIAQARQAHSRAEMEALVARIGGPEQFS